MRILGKMKCIQMTRCAIKFSRYLPVSCTYEYIHLCFNYFYFVLIYGATISSVSAMWRNQSGIFLCKMTRALVLLCMAIILPLVRCHKVRSQSSILKTQGHVLIPCNYFFKRQRAHACAQRDNPTKLKHPRSTTTNFINCWSHYCEIDSRCLSSESWLIWFTHVILIFI